jgi:hypothetical protein
MGRRRRAIAFLTLAVTCGLASAALAARYRGGVEEGYGPLRTVVLVEREIEAGSRFSDAEVSRSLRSGEVPERFVPSDALFEPDQALGAELLGTVPAGSYLLASHLREPDAERGGLGDGRRPIEVSVAAAGSLARPGAVADRVDVIAAEEPGVSSGPRVVVLARKVPLLGLRRSGPQAADDGGDWVATLGLRRRQSLTVIEAENFSRELRLLPR